MNKKLLLSAFIGLSLAAGAQTIPNGGMETWNNSGPYSDPAQWGTSNAAVFLGAPVTCAQSSDAHSGTYSAQLTTQDWDFNGTPVVLPGTIFFGSVDVIAQQINQGRPWTERTDSIVFWYKYTPMNGDAGTVVGALRRWDTQAGSQEIIATLDATINPAATWTRMAVAFNYGGMSASNPDTIELAIASSGQNGGTAGSELFVDDISSVKNAPLSIKQEVKDISISVYPSPANDHVTVALSKEATVEIYNALGQRIASYRNAAKNFSISTEDFVNGVYMVRTSSGLTQRFVVRH